ncbi:hypothetical protein BJV78DRAFT_1208176 [Lactifluus subvellereus]|nr:hypothetical protein BJV78DRAFT_1208176 [Lactifluus subvellereus]
MQYICMTHTLVNAVRLTEEEVVLGMVLARCAQPRWRTDRSYRMQVHAEGPVQDRWPLEDMVRAGLSNVRAVSSWAQHRGNKEFMEFLVVVAGVVLDRLERLGELLEAYVRAIEKVLYEG